jgi:hypothetical protein
MKKIIIIALFVAATGSAFSQAKTDTLKKSTAATEAPKPEYKQDPNKLYQIPLNLTLTQIQLLTASPEDWKAIKTGKLTGEQITSYEDGAQELRKSILGYVTALQQQDYAKWLNKSDSTKAVPAKIKAKNQKK